MALRCGFKKIFVKDEKRLQNRPLFRPDESPSNPCDTCAPHPVEFPICLHAKNENISSKAFSSIQSGAIGQTGPVLVLKALGWQAQKCAISSVFRKTNPGDFMENAFEYRHQKFLETSLEKIFPAIDPAFFAAILPLMQTIELPGGCILMKQGDSSDAIYFVLSGRLQANIQEADGQSTLRSEFGRGEPIGEIGVISGACRSATVTALRDCKLLKLAATDFMEILSKFPPVTLQLTRKLVHRLSNDQKTTGINKRIINVCLLPLSARLDIAQVAQRLQGTLLAQLERSRSPEHANAFTVGLIDRASVQSALGPDAADATRQDQGKCDRLLAWLDQQETESTMQVFVADCNNSAWTHMCIRQADHILLVADAQDSSSLRDVERHLLADISTFSAASQSIWLVHPNDCKMPSQTSAWLQARPHIPSNGWSHFHTRCDHAQDWGRLARMLSGQAVGLILAGGGARGFSHLGVMRALEEKGIEWDVAGGTSIGSVVAAFAAMDLPIPKVTELLKKAFSGNPTGDVNWLPLMSLVKGHRLKQLADTVLRQATGASIDIEDLWKPYFCVASNYSRQEMAILRRGSLVQAVLASTAIPAALPPILRDGDLMLDGASFNNYPVDIMKASGVRRTIGVDLGRGYYRPLPYKALPSTWQLFVDRYIRSRKQRRFKGIPSLATIVFNATVMSRTTHEKRMRQELDLSFTPNVSKYGMLDWKSFSSIVEIGLQHGRERIQEYPDVHSPTWFSR